MFLVFFSILTAISAASNDVIKAYPQSDYCVGAYDITEMKIGTKGIITSDASNSLRNYTSFLACSWTIRTAPKNLIKLSFDYSITECGWDYVNVYDGMVGNSELLGALTGYRTYVSNSTFSNPAIPLYGKDIIISSRNILSVSFNADEQVEDPGFRATFEIIDSDCKNSGSCSNGTCICVGQAVGLLCEKASLNFNKFVARQQHAVTYDPISDKAYISFGKMASKSTSFSGFSFANDIVIYDFSKESKDAWTLLPLDFGPTPRFSHYSFIHKGMFYIVGGVTSNASPYSEVWAFNIATSKWKQAPQYISLVPPSYESAQFVFDPISEQIFLYGGLSYKNGVPSVDYRLFSYSLENGEWSQKTKNGIALYGATATYHPKTNSIYYTGGYKFEGEHRVQRYSIASDLWFNVGSLYNDGQLLPPLNDRSFAQAIYIEDKDLILVVGGQTPGMRGIEEMKNVCFSPYVQFFDVSCQRWTQIEIPELAFKQRANHGLFLRNGTVWIVGGQNGFFLGDMISFDLSSVYSQVQSRLTTDYEKEICRSLKWCSGGSYYECKDCAARPYCQWCSNRNTCEYIGVDSKTKTKSIDDKIPEFNPPTGLIDLCGSKSCPTDIIPISFNDLHNGTLFGDKPIQYRLVLDALNYDVIVTITQLKKFSATIFLKIYSGSFLNMDLRNAPVIKIAAGSNSRYVGPYIIMVQTPFIADKTSETGFTIMVSKQVSDGRVYAQPGQTIDITAMISVFMMSMSFWLLLNYSIQRLRDRLFWSRLARDHERILRKRVPPTMFIATLGLPRKIGKVGERKSRRSLTHSRNSEPEFNFDESSTMLKLNKGISQFLHLLNFDTSQSNSRTTSTQSLDNVSKKEIEKEAGGNHGIVKTFFGRHLAKKSSAIELEEGTSSKALTEGSQTETLKIKKSSKMEEIDDEESMRHVVPIAIEAIDADSVKSLPQLVAMHYTIIFPNAASFIKEGLLPPIAIGTTLHVDTNKRVSKPAIVEP